MKKTFLLAFFSLCYAVLTHNIVSQSVSIVYGSDSLQKPQQRQHAEEEEIPIAALNANANANANANPNDALSFAEECALAGLDVNKLIDLSKSEVEKYMNLLYRRSESIARTLPPLTNLTAPPLDPLDCSIPPFSGRTRATPATIIDLLPFNGEFEALEIRLHELSDSVDLHVILESPSSHHMFRKPMALARRMEDFREFWPRIRLLHDDDSDVQRRHPDRFDGAGNNTDAFVSEVDWRMESDMRQLLWEKGLIFRKGSAADTIHILGDPDEIPNRNMINHFKHCEVLAGQDERHLSFKYHQTFYRHNFMFQLDGQNRPSCGAGSILVGANNPSGSELRNGKSCVGHLEKWPGMHLNRVTDVYMDVSKDLTISEGGKVAALGKCSPTGNITEAIYNPLLCNRRRNRGSRICCDDHPPFGKAARINEVSDPRPSHVYLPWIVDQNRDHFRFFFPPFDAES